MVSNPYFRADLGFDKFEFPKRFTTPGELPEAGFDMRAFRKRLQALIDTVPDRKRALNSMHSYATAADPKGNFSGKIIEPPKGFEGGAETLWVSFVEIYCTFNQALKFENQMDGTILYAGNDWELKKTYEPHGFEIVGVASDKKEDLNKFFKKNGELPWLTIVDTKSAIAERLKIDVMPTYLLVDKKGKHIATPRDKEELGELIAKLLNIDPIPLKKD